VRREIAKISLERLMADGRIQPQRIEEIVEITKQDIEKIMYAAGEDLCHQVGVYNLPRELVALLGRFKYRYSYGQNMIQHTLEETRIGIALATQLGANVNIVRLGCLLHDIGKVADMDDEGTHVEKGVALAKKYELSKEVVNCIAQHHEDEPFSSTESILCYIADAISGARPGARREDVEDYIEDGIQRYLVYIGSPELNTMGTKITQAGFVVESAELTYKPNTLVNISDKGVAEKVLGFAEKLEDLDDVQKVYANFDIPEELLVGGS